MKNFPIRYLKGVGPKKEAVFKSLGIYTAEDLIYYFPHRYEDRSNFKKIKELKVEELCAIKGKVLVRHLKKIPYFVSSRRVRDIFDVVLSDNTGKIPCVWFNQGYLADMIKVGDEIIIYGKPIHESNKLKIISPECELAGVRNSLNLGRIVGFYRLAAKINQKFMRRIIYSALGNFRGKVFDPLPFYIRKGKNIPNIAKSLEEIHFPHTWKEAEVSRERFIFEELFFSQILVYLRKAKHRQQEGIAFKVNKDILKRIRENLPFSLTSSQKEVLSKIISDLEKPYPMQRLLQGDVGCGKTVVCAFAIGVSIDCGYQSALMVPTEVLAYQHKETMNEIFKGLGYKIEVLVSSLPKKKIEDIYRELKEGNIDFIIGTHSLIQEELAFKKLGLTVIDEQHKFGVAQRALLPKKGKVTPHCLVMSATPIPRSLALTLYGDLDLSVIKELPKGRLHPKTTWVKERKRDWVYDFLRERLKGGRQAYIIYPVIEESEEHDLKSLEEMYEKVAREFAPFKVEMFHGRMKAEDKIEVIKKFKGEKIDILLSTTVVEVGVNIENATIMIVESPQKFGLAQLHQLRGRIQRSIHQPYFILIAKDNLPQNVLKRLKVIVEVSDGFKIAEEDLKLRGPGDFFGLSQHGFPQLKIANPLRDLETLKQARLFAYKAIKSDPYLEKPHHRCIKDHIDSVLTDKE